MTVGVDKDAVQDWAIERIFQFQHLRASSTQLQRLPLEGRPRADGERAVIESSRSANRRGR